MDTEALERAIALRESGQIGEALREFTALANSADNAEEKATLLLNESRCYRLLGELAEARHRMEMALKIAPRTTILPYLEFEDAVLNWHEGNREKALCLLDTLCKDRATVMGMAEHHDLFQQVQSSRGMLLTELERYDFAVPVLEESISFDSRVVDREGLLRDLGLCYLKLGNGTRAKRKFEACIQQDPDSVYAIQAHFWLGTIAFAEGAFSAAMEHFQACLTRAEEALTQKRDVYRWLAATARKLGQAETALQFETLAKAGPN